MALHIFEHGIQKILLKRKRTIILRTHRKDILKNSSWILHFDSNGRLELQGTFEDLWRCHKELFDEKVILFPNYMVHL